jgi:preprotein translocase subunit YajC
MQDLAGLLPLVLVLVVFWLFVIRPARNRQRELAQTQQAIRPGQQVMTSAGLHAGVVSVEDDVVVLEVAPGVHSRYARQAVVRVLDVPSQSEPDGAARADEGTPGTGI